MPATIKQATTKRETMRKTAGKRAKTATPAETSRRAKTPKPAKPAKRKYWSADVTRKSNALDIEHGAFALSDPKKIALSLKRSAERSERRKAGPYQSAMSMLNFYINRAGRNLPVSRKRILAQAKTELRKLFHRA